MKKNIIIGFAVAVCLSTAISANQLKDNMYGMSSSLSVAQIGFFNDSQEATLAAVLELKMYVKKTVGDDKAIVALLPKELKHKAAVAIESVNIINTNIASMEKNLKDKSMRNIDRQMNTQKSFMEIQKQCFRCHNLVRDWKNLD